MILETAAHPQTSLAPTRISRGLDRNLALDCANHEKAHSRCRPLCFCCTTLGKGNSVIFLGRTTATISILQSNLRAAKSNILPLLPPGTVLACAHTTTHQTDKTRLDFCPFLTTTDGRTNDGLTEQRPRHHQIYPQAPPTTTGRQHTDASQATALLIPSLTAVSPSEPRPARASNPSYHTLRHATPREDPTW